ncbi:hypothetical protein FRC18_008219, partial [Serendipita sp. 400]
MSGSGGWTTCLLFEKREREREGQRIVVVSGIQNQVKEKEKNVVSLGGIGGIHTKAGGEGEVAREGGTLPRARSPWAVLLNSTVHNPCSTHEDEQRERVWHCSASIIIVQSRPSSNPLLPRFR